MTNTEHPRLTDRRPPTNDQQNVHVVRRWSVVISQIVIVLTVGVVLAVLPVRLLLQPWIIHFEYNRLSPDEYGMNPAERLRLGLDGLESIAGPEGMAVLYRAQFDDGQPAFAEREISHMLDVRIVAGQLFTVQAIAFVLMVAVGVVLYRSPATRLALAAALRTGALAVLAAVVGVSTFVVMAFNSFFTTFHQLFFSGDSWLFAYTDTLIRLYPLQFWIDVTVMICVAIVVESVALAAFAWWWYRRLSRSEMPTPPH